MSEGQFFSDRTFKLHMPVKRSNASSRRDQMGKRPIPRPVLRLLRDDIGTLRTARAGMGEHAVKRRAWRQILLLPLRHGCCSSRRHLATLCNRKK